MSTITAVQAKSKTPAAKVKKPVRIGGGCATKTDFRTFCRQPDHPNFGGMAELVTGPKPYFGVWSLHARPVVVECEPVSHKKLAQSILDHLTVLDLVEFWSSDWFITKKNGAASGDILLDMIETCLVHKLSETLYPDDSAGSDRLYVRVEYHSPSFHKWHPYAKEAEAIGGPRPDPKDPFFFDSVTE